MSRAVEMAQRDPVPSPREQREVLDEIDLRPARSPRASFLDVLGAEALQLVPRAPEILQVNLGRLCNMSCRHCHVDAGPDRADAVMSGDTVEACLRLARSAAVSTVDLTGGAPELNPGFRRAVEGARELGLHVIDRCNLTVLLLPEQRDLPAWLAERRVEVVCSLPHFRRRNTDALRGGGAFEQSIEALRRLNQAGYGGGDGAPVLTIMLNPAGAFLPGSQASLEREWKDRLARDHGVRFDRLIALNNMPIGRFQQWLVQTANLERYVHRLVEAFNGATVAGLMCRNTLSVSWQGRLYDCDFNQMLDLEALDPEGRPFRLAEVDLEAWRRRRIRTGRHCFGCTAGAGSSCGGTLE